MQPCVWFRRSSLLASVIQASTWLKLNLSRLPPPQCKKGRHSGVNLGERGWRDPKWQVELYLQKISGSWHQIPVRMDKMEHLKPKVNLRVTSRLKSTTSAVTNRWVIMRMTHSASTFQVLIYEKKKSGLIQSYKQDITSAKYNIPNLWLKVTLDCLCYLDSLCLPNFKISIPFFEAQGSTENACNHFPNCRLFQE